MNGTRKTVPDRPARREAWNNTIDFYIKDGMLPSSAANWAHPKWLETYGHRRGNPPAREGRDVLPAIDIKVLVSQLIQDGRHLMDCQKYTEAAEAFHTALTYSADASMPTGTLRALMRYKEAAEEAARRGRARAANPGSLKRRLLSENGYCD